MDISHTCRFPQYWKNKLCWLYIQDIHYFCYFSLFIEPVPWFDRPYLISHSNYISLLNDFLLQFLPHFIQQNHLGKIKILFLLLYLDLLFSSHFSWSIYDQFHYNIMIWGSIWSYFFNLLTKFTSISERTFMLHIYLVKSFIH